jgi:hypothetical protein
VVAGPVRVNVVAVIVAGSIASLNVAEIVASAATVVASLSGTVDITVGGEAVVNVHTKLAASAVPVGSFAPVVIVAMYRVAVARTAVGVNVAVVPVYVAVPDTGVAPGPVKMNVAAVIVAESIPSLKVAEMAVFTATAVVPLAGIVEMTVGGTPVVKVQAKLAANAAPVGSLAPVVIVAVYKVPAARTADGVNVAVLPE